MIGIVIPAHDEEATLHACLRAARKAASHPQLQGEAVRIAVVLDSCSDASEAIARRHPVTVLPLQVRNVGLARHHGAQALIPGIVVRREVAHIDAADLLAHLAQQKSADALWPALRRLVHKALQLDIAPARQRIHPAGGHYTIECGGQHIVSRDGEDIAR